MEYSMHIQQLYRWGKTELEYLKNRLMYPEKFFKVANSYYHSNKAWISIKNVEKMQMAVRQMKEK